MAPAPMPTAAAPPPAAAVPAAGYSRFVRVMQISLPLLATALVIVFVAFSLMNRTLGDLTISVADLARMGKNLEMRNPTLTYTDEAQRSFIVQADKAVQVDGATNHWHLQTIRARMNPPAGAGYRLTSIEGLLDADEEILELKGDVRVDSDQGYTFEARTAHVDLGAGRVTSNEPVRAMGPGTTIDSDRFVLWDKGDRVRFEGRVRFVTVPHSPSDAPAEDAP